MRSALIAVASALLAGCASDRVTLLDNEEGEAQFALADITRPGKERVLDTQMSELRLGRTSRAKTLRKIRTSDTDLIRALPPKAARFTFNFPTDEVRIPDSQRPMLALIRDQMVARGAGAQIEVVGFTDSAGEADDNDALSQRRAEVVAQQLRELGFEIAPQDAVGRGEDDAQAALGDGVASANFRKVEVVVR